jgi:two-component system response regulator BaeR
MSARVMIVEDEPELAALVADYVRAAGFTPAVYGNGAEALAAARATAPDVLVLDLMLPGLDGLAVCRAVRAFSTLPIIMVTAQVEEIDRLLGLETGADDYLCKPFSPRELVARIKALLRRAGYAAGGVPAAVVAIDEAGRRVLVRGQALDLTPSEFPILAGMARHPGQVFSRARLLDLAGQDKLDTGDRAVDSHIKNLRRKLAAVLPGAELITALYGLGYRFDMPIHDSSTIGPDTGLS